MMLPLWDGLVATNHFDFECAQLADRHYSRRTVGARQFLYSGRKLVLRDPAGLVLFGWLWPDESMRLDKQTGYFCAIFRNESQRRSSNIILEAEAMAFAKWGPNRVFTYVDGSKIKSPNPGYCFKKAGWSKIGMSKAGLTLLAKEKSPRGHA
jgi:hypothetical protein